MPINDKRKERDTSFKRPFHFQLFNLMKKVYKACWDGLIKAFLFCFEFRLHGSHSIRLLLISFTNSPKAFLSRAVSSVCSSLWFTWMRASTKSEGCCSISITILPWKLWAESTPLLPKVGYSAHPSSGSWGAWRLEVRDSFQLMDQTVVWVLCFLLQHRDSHSRDTEPGLFNIIHSLSYLRTIALNL